MSLKLLNVIQNFQIHCTVRFLRKNKVTDVAFQNVFENKMFLVLYNLSVKLNTHQFHLS